MSVSVVMELGSKVRVAGRGNNLYEVVEKVSPIRVGDWIVRKPNGSMLSVNPSILKVVK
jgi:hypothetical protein